jgi:hypothetical protein
MLAALVKHKLPRAIARLGFDRERGARNHAAAIPVDAVDEDFVFAQVGDEHMLAFGIGRDLMYMRAGLTLGVRAAAVVLHKAGGGAEAAVRKNGQNREAAAGEVRNQQMAVVCGQADAAGIPAAGHATVEEGQFARLLVNRVG